MSSQRLEPETVIGGYRIVKHLGSGGMGGVYAAEHIKLGKTVALKAMHPEVAEDEESLARFLREGQSACKLDHPHVVDVFDVGVDDGIAYLVMERLRGHDLSHFLEAEERLPFTELVDLMLPIASALQDAHQAGVVHRDLKPDNVFVVEDRHGRRHPKLLDFGISKVTDPDADRLTKTSAVMGTPYYMSPEQARGSGDIDGRSDQWSFGVILFQGLAGALPINGETVLEVLYNIHNGNHTQLTEHRDDLPEGLVEVVHRMLRLEREDRYPDVLAAGAALLPYASETARALWSPEMQRSDKAEPPPKQRTVLGHNNMQAEDMLAATATPARAIDLSASAKLALAVSSDTSIDLPSTEAEERPEDAPVPVGLVTDSVTLPERPWYTRPVVLVALLLLMGGAVGTGVFLLPGDAPSDGPPAGDAPPSATPAILQIELEVTPRTAQIRLDDGPTVEGTLRAEVVQDGSEHVLHVAAPGYESMQIGFRDTAPPAQIELTALPAAAREPAEVADPTTGEAEPVRLPDTSPPRPRPRPRPRPTAEPTPPSPPPSSSPEVGANRSVIIP